MEKHYCKIPLFSYYHQNITYNLLNSSLLNYSFSIETIDKYGIKFITSMEIIEKNNGCRIFNVPIKSIYKDNKYLYIYFEGSYHKNWMEYKADEKNIYDNIFKFNKK